MGKKEKTAKDAEAAAEIKRRPLKEIMADSKLEKNMKSIIEKNYDTALYPEMFYTARDFDAARRLQHIKNKEDYHREREETILNAENEAKGIK